MSYTDLVIFTVSATITGVFRVIVLMMLANICHFISTVYPHAPQMMLNYKDILETVLAFGTLKGRLFLLLVVPVMYGLICHYCYILVFCQRRPMAHTATSQRRLSKIPISPAEYNDPIKFVKALSRISDVAQASRVRTALDNITYVTGEV